MFCGLILGVVVFFGAPLYFASSKEGGTLSKILQSDPYFNLGQLGDFWGGFLNPSLTLASCLFFLGALKLQREEQKDSKEQFSSEMEQQRKEMSETREIHKDNLNSTLKNLQYEKVKFLVDRLDQTEDKISAHDNSISGFAVLELINAKKDEGKIEFVEELFEDNRKYISRCKNIFERLIKIVIDHDDTDNSGYSPMEYIEDNLYYEYMELYFKLISNLAELNLIKGFSLESIEFFTRSGIDTD